MSALVVPMKRRKLRIAWSAAWGIVAVLLVALWVRSYWVLDYFGFPTSSQVRYDTYSNCGRWVLQGNPFLGDPKRFYYGQSTPYPNDDTPNVPPFHRALGVNWMLSGAGPYISISYVWLILFVVILALWPWVGPSPSLGHFSLRTLLIATMLVAVALGLIVWAAK